jgi:hypothetical protein
MDNLNGKWIGQYVQQSGMDNQEDLNIDSFEFELIEIEGEVKGKSIDLDLENEPGTINGFYENGILSFIKKYHRLFFQDEGGNIVADNNSESAEIKYTATYDDEEKAFVGTWEIHLDEQPKGYQEEYVDQYDSGDFYMRKIAD